MALPARITKIEDVAEAFRKEYAAAEDGNGFLLDVTGFDDLPGVQGLKGKNKELLGKLSDANKKIKEWDSLDLDELQKKVADYEKNGGDFEKVRSELEGKIKQMTEASSTEIAAAKAEAESERAAARGFYLDSVTDSAIAKAKGNPELLGHIVKKSLKVERTQDGKFSVAVLDANGQQRIKNGKGELFTVEDLVGEMRANTQKYGGAFESTAKDGSGASGSSNGNGGTPKTVSRSTPGVFSKYAKEIASGEVTLID